MPFTVELDPSGNRFAVEADENILEAALRENVLLPYGCRNGACGSCKARLLEGDLEFPGVNPRHVLTERELARGWTLLCQAHPRSDVRIAAEELDRDRNLTVRTLPVRVARAEQLAHDVVALYLQLPPSERLQFLAGQYIDILLRDGRRRAFSLANAPFDDEFLVLHIRQIPGGSFSEQVLPKLKPRALLRIHGPLGNFFLRTNTQRPMILVAGGTGLAPIRSMIEDARYHELEREMHLYWGVRQAHDLYDLQWARSLAGVSFTPVLSDPDPDWNGRTGFVHQAVLEDHPRLAPFDVYASGPPVMVNAIREAFPEHGLPIERLYFDSFDYAYETGHDA